MMEHKMQEIILIKKEQIVLMNDLAHEHIKLSDRMVSYYFV